MKLLEKIYENGKLFDIAFINNSDFYELLLRFGFNLLIILLIVWFLYYSVAKRKDYLFTYLLISITVFLLCFLLENVKLKLGFALGLFAVFSIIRYRTTTIPIREMTYLFVTIGISVINALANTKISYMELLFANAIIVLIIFLFEKVFFLRHLSVKNITYEKIDLIQAGRRDELIKDLEKRCGLKIEKIEIGKINFLQDTANIKIYYYEKDNNINLADAYDDEIYKDNN